MTDPSGPPVETPVEIGPEELRDWIDRDDAPVLLDVRETWEWDLVHLPGSRHVPMGSLMSRHGELDPEQPVVVVCHHGVRSLNSTLFLRSVGFRDARSLRGGIDLWAQKIDRSLPTY